MAPLYRLGVDVGGTNTDAALVDINQSDQPGRGVLASHKSQTTPDITSGIEKAIAAVLSDLSIDKNRIISVNIGTTHFINALIEADARRLDRVAVVRICGPFTRQIPPFSDVPHGLRKILDGGAYYLDGGCEIDGRTISKLDLTQVLSAVEQISSKGIRAVAIVGVFAPLTSAENQEEQCEEIFAKHAPDVQVVCSQNIGPTGFLERENATILNAAILNTAKRVTKGFLAAMSRLEITCPLFLSQNDGTLIDVDTAAKYPIKTFASGPTNSVVGASFLAGMDDPQTDHQRDSQILVVDIGGTTTDVCALLSSGFPRPAPGFVEVGGVRTAFSIPEVASIGLGGGSIVQWDSAKQEEVVTVGPSSVGHAIHEHALIFGGSTLTATDVAVAVNDLALGNVELTKYVPLVVIEAARRQIKRMLEKIIDEMKVSQAPVHVLLVGGGAILAPSTLKGVETLVRPIHSGAANAVGAAIAKVCGEIDVVEMIEGRSEEAILAEVQQRAIDLAIHKGAIPEDVRVVEVNKMPLQYTHRSAMRIQIRAVGKLAHSAGPTQFDNQPTALQQANGVHEEEGTKVVVDDALLSHIKPSLNISITDYCPDVRQQVWYVSEVDLEFIASGCGVLGTGGGGPTHYEFLKSLIARRTNPSGKMRVVSPTALEDSDVVCSGAWYGSPSVLNERIGGGNEIPLALQTVGKLVGANSFQGFLAPEIGGGNGMSAFHISANLDVPVIDGDSMGRAYPTIGHTTFNVYGYRHVPCVLTDARDNVLAVSGAEDPQRLEGLMRTAAVDLGLACGVAATPRSGADVKAHAVPNTISLAWYLGRSIHTARQCKSSIIEAIFSVCPGKLLFSGKIVDVRRFIGRGYTMGAVIIKASSDDELDTSDHGDCKSGRHMYIPFQNEYLFAAESDAEGSVLSQKVVCTVPHLISILGQDGEAIGSQDLRYGLHVSVIMIPAHPLWTTGRALKVGGPEGFGLRMPVRGGDDHFKPLKSVIEEFSDR